MMEKLKVMTIVGTRPELIRLALIIKKFDKLFDHTFVHTGQNFDKTLHEQFFADLDLRLPDVQLNQDQKVGTAFIGTMLTQMDELVDRIKPEACLILGDTNSALAAYVCKQKGVSVFHMEAGNRCYSDKVPEEVNRRVVDSVSDILMPYTQRSREQLLREGYKPERVIVTGNPLTEVMDHYESKADDQGILTELGLEGGGYYLATLHRAENLQDEGVLRGILDALNRLAESKPLVLSVHPRLRSKLDAFKISLGKGIIAAQPFNFTQFIALMKQSALVLSDSGTVPEEASLLQVPCVLMRDSTERPELLENNSMVVSGVKTRHILQAAEVALDLEIGDPPIDYLDADVSSKVAKIISHGKACYDS